jgi:hypothetical protein
MVRLLRLSGQPIGAPIRDAVLMLHYHLGVHTENNLLTLDPDCQLV